MHLTTTLMLMFATAPGAAPVAQSPVPANLTVPAGNTPFLVTHAVGTQNYMCVQVPTGFAWTFFGPQATLFDGAGQQAATHFLSRNPVENGAARATWQHSADSSAAWAAAIASSSDPAFVSPGAIPWLLLRAVGTQVGPNSGDLLAGTTYIQRVNTEGGAAPETGCRSVQDAGRKALVPYSTDYIFFKAN